jgi:hypothetical protein
MSQITTSSASTLQRSTEATSFGTRTQPAPGATASPMPFHRYRPFTPIDLPDRTWPSHVITKARAGCQLIFVTATRR